MMKTVLITGGSRGIGEACVRRFARDGYAVAFTYHHSEEKAKKIANETGAVALCADVADSASVNEAVRQAKEALGHIDVLINNAGEAMFGLLPDTTDSEWDRLFRVNVNGAFYASRAVLPEMITRKSGVILNVSSMWGTTGASCEVAYSATKAALDGMTKALAKEVGPSGIRVCGVAPGTVDTDMNAHLTDADLTALADDTPLGRIASPAEVAAALAFLASPDASFITGVILPVNGGFVI